MDKRDTPFIGALVALVILTVVGAFTLPTGVRKSVENGNQPPSAANEPAPTPPPEPTIDESAKYFQERLVALGVEDVGQPIEGFDPELLIIAFPGLTRADFHNAATLDGRYELRGEELVFVRGQGNMVSSAERTVSYEGFATLLTNVSVRLRMSADTQADIDAIIARIDTSQRIQTKIDQGGSALGTKVVPLKLLDDSRCPTDVTCIQAGTVRVRALVDGGSGESRQTFILDKPVTTASATVTLARVDPEPFSGMKIDPADYIFFFEIEKR